MPGWAARPVRWPSCRPGLTEAGIVNDAGADCGPDEIGEHVYPAEVENALYQLPQVAEAAVIGVPSAEWGEVGLAVLVLKPGQQIDPAAVIGHCIGRLAGFKLPQDIAVIDALPRNGTGKVLKRELRRQFVGSQAPAIS